jgi:uncharacterized protein YunC (DUF1805 family)
MNATNLQASQRAIVSELGKALGCSYRWPGGQYCAIHTDRGLIGCGLYDCSVATRFGMAVAIARGTPQHPLLEPEDLLEAQIAEVSEAAGRMGITVGMTGQAALDQMLRVGDGQQQT